MSERSQKYELYKKISEIRVIVEKLCRKEAKKICPNEAKSTNYAEKFLKIEELSKN